MNATWVDLGRATSGPSFRAGTGSSARALPLLGSGIAVQIDGRWVGVAEPGESTLRPAPAWLGDAADFAPIRGAKAYAIVPPSGGVIAIVSSQGNACGTVAFPGVNGAAVGLDGTVVGSTGASGCTKYVWRNALR